MKHLRKLLCVAVAMLWVLPVSAMEWDQRGRAVLDQTGFNPVLKSMQPLSEWIAVNEDEYLLFDSAEYELHFELQNAVWDSAAARALVIEAFDETGMFLDSDTFTYIVNTSFIPNVLTIAPASQGDANTYVRALPANEPTTRRIQIRPVLVIDEVQDCDQQVTMRTWFRYDSALVGTSLPDHMVVPSVFLNSC